MSEETSLTRVLLVDDNPLVLKGFSRCLSPDHDVATALGGLAAIELITDGEPDFDVVLCDLFMCGMSGDISGTGARAFLDTVPNARLQKPIDIGDLRAAIRDARL